MNYSDMARGLKKEAFVNACPYCFLLGQHQLITPAKPQPTQIFNVPIPGSLLVDGGHSTGRERKLTPLGEPIVVLPVRKIQAAFPSMITLGRTANNDLAVQDVSVSKFHAFFRTQGNMLQLADAGSRNGTFVETQRLTPKGPAVPVAPGMRLQFGEVQMTLIDAAACWERLRKG
jgi:hypothetical protein